MRIIYDYTKRLLEGDLRTLPLNQLIAALEEINHYAAQELGLKPVRWFFWNKD